MTTPAISLVIVLYGQRAVTEMGLTSLSAALGASLGTDVELVLVDNASPDDTGELLDGWEDRATVVRNPLNLNFSGGCNAGARASGGEVLVFLNNDMEFVPGAIEAVAATVGDPTVGAAGCRLLFPDGTLQHAGVIWTASENGPAMPQHVFHQEAGDLPAACATIELDAVTAACIAIRRELFLELGGFDETYRNGLEDIDLCLRIRSRGLRIVYRGDICLVHHESSTRGVDDVAAAAYNDVVFQARWSALCGADDELARDVYGGELTSRCQLPLVPHEYGPGGTISLDGHLRSVAPEAAEARALLVALELAGLAPCSRDRLPAYLIASLTKTERTCLQAAANRLRSPTALRVEVPAGRLYSLRRRHGDILRLAAVPDDLAHLDGVTAIWAATAQLATDLIELGVDERRVAVLPPAILPVPVGAGGAGVLALLPGHDAEACAAALLALNAVRDVPVRVLANVVTPELRRRATEVELLPPTTSEEAFAAYAAAADVVACLDPSDAFGRRRLIAAAVGAVTAGPAEDLAAAVTAALEQATDGRAARSAEVLAIHGVPAIAPRLPQLVAQARAAGADLLSRLAPVPAGGH